MDYSISYAEIIIAVGVWTNTILQLIWYKNTTGSKGEQ